MSGAVVTFPGQGNWIPNQTQFSDAASGLLLVCGAALDQQGRGQEYARRVFSHGIRVPWKLGQKQGARGQILVSFVKAFIGKAGQEQFQFIDGEIGKAGKRTMQFHVQVVNTWPVLKGGTTAMQETDESLMAQATETWQDCCIVLSSLWALALRGVQIEPPIPALVQNNVLVGAMEPVGPEGGLAGMEVPVYVQM